MHHLLEQAEPGSCITSLDAAVHQCVVHQLIAAQPAGLDGLGNLEGLVKVAGVAVAFQQSGERDEVRLEAAVWARHVPDDALSCREVSTLHTGVDHRVVGDGVVRHTLNRHLTEEFQSTCQILLQTIALDEGCVQDGVLMLACFPHGLENVNGLLEIAALDAGINHAAIGHCIGLLPLHLHLLPNLQHLRQVACLTISLHQDAKCYR
mmetsp:Transcript_73542/g.118658  ORF Transcript_73542/g.118658 Transcript_73542/m.118658 type:complete len:207 (-) Transcript_73542:544-1164(-)